MNIFNRTKAAVLVAIILPGVAVTAYAHDPSMHKKSKEKPNCQAMSKMDKEKMQSGDPGHDGHDETVRGSDARR